MSETPEQFLVSKLQDLIQAAETSIENLKNKLATETENQKIETQIMVNDIWRIALTSTLIQWEDRKCTQLLSTKLNTHSQSNTPSHQKETCSNDEC